MTAKSTLRRATSGLDEVLARILDAFPPLSSEGQDIAITLYKQLAAGQPVRREELASSVNRPTPEVEGILDETGMRTRRLYDERRRIVGFGGLSVRPTDHRLVLPAGTVYTWCVWDALFIPGLLRSDAILHTTCPGTGAAIALVIADDGVVPPDDDHVMSLRPPDQAVCAISTERSIACFCSNVRLYVSAHAARTARSRINDALLLPITDAFELGRRYRRARFPLVEGWPG